MLDFETRRLVKLAVSNRRREQTAAPIEAQRPWTDADDAEHYRWLAATRPSRTRRMIEGGDDHA